MANSFFAFQKLLVWQKSRQLVKDVYSAISDFPAIEQYALTSQIRRAVVSVPSNIAEGSSRGSERDQVRFLEIAYGSLIETFCQLQIAVDLGYLTQENFDRLAPSFEELAKMLSALRRNKQAKIL
jgi:four helix bundle protein